MRRTLLVVTGLPGLAKMVSVSAGNTENMIPALENQTVQASLWDSLEDGKPGHSYCVCCRFGVSADFHSHHTAPVALQDTRGPIDQAPAVRLASISLTAPFSR